MNEVQNIDQDGIGIQGYDPVSYFESTPQKGDPKIAAEYKGVRYHFVSRENRGKFAVDPRAYLPMYGGYCATGMAGNMLVPIDPENYRIENDRLFLFYDGEMGNTRPAWEADPTDMFTKAESNWQAADFDPA